jgi:hypothetical protein
MTMRWKVGRTNLRCRRDRWWARPLHQREKFLLLRSVIGYGGVLFFLGYWVASV